MEDNCTQSVQHLFSAIRLGAQEAEMLAWMGGKRKKFALWKKDCSKRIGIRRQHKCLRKVPLSREYDKLAAKKSHYGQADKLGKQHDVHACSRKESTSLKSTDQRSLDVFSLEHLGIGARENNSPICELGK